MLGLFYIGHTCIEYIYAASTQIHRANNMPMIRINRDRICKSPPFIILIVLVVNERFVKEKNKSVALVILQNFEFKTFHKFNFDKTIGLAFLAISLVYRYLNTAIER